MSVCNVYSRLKAYLTVFTSLVFSVSLVLSALLFFLVSLVPSASVARIFRFFKVEVGTSLAVLHILEHIEPKQRHDLPDFVGFTLLPSLNGTLFWLLKWKQLLRKRNKLRRERRELGREQTPQQTNQSNIACCI
jgi:hypothetical protein